MKHSFISSLYTPLSIILALAVLPNTYIYADVGHDHGGPAEPLPIQLNTATAKFHQRGNNTELVATLIDDRLILYIDDYATNEPIAGAHVMVESNGQKANATTTAPGTYQLNAPWLTQPGNHEVLVNIKTKTFDDNLSGILKTPKEDSKLMQTTDWLGSPPWLNILIVILLVLPLVVFAIIKLKRPSVSKMGMLVAAVLFVAASQLPQTAFADVGHDHGGDDSSEKTDSKLEINTNRPQRQPGGQVFVPKPTQRLLEIRTQLTSNETVPLSLRLSGHVKPNPNYQGQVQAAITGRIEPNGQPLPYIGQWVKKGALLTQLAPVAGRFDQGNQQAQLAELNNALNLARKRLTRLEKLEGSIPLKTLEEARNDITSLQERHTAVAKSLGGFETLVAPVSGYITKADVKPGQIAEEGELLFEIINPKKLRVEALSYARNRNTEIENAYIIEEDGTSLALKPLGRGRTLRGHAVPYLFDVQQANPPLTVEQAVEVVVTTKNKITGIVVARSALVKNRKGKDIVWIHDNPEMFSPRQVKWKIVDGSRVVITNGVTADERVVTRGATLLTQIR